MEDENTQMGIKQAHLTLTLNWLFQERYIYWCTP